MTESEWLECADPVPMLEFLKGRAGDRKLRLFACACCRAVWDLLTHESSRQAVEAAERYADGLVGDDALRRAHSIGCQAVASHLEVEFRSRRPLVTPARPTVTECRLRFAANTAHVHRPVLIGRLKELRWDPDMSAPAPGLLRDVFGPLPFRPVTADPSWLTPTVVALAAEMYETRDFSAMPILADALQEAGCESEDVLNHCRGSGPHARGCWVVDLVLGKS